MRSSGPYSPLDPGPGAKFREFPKAREEGVMPAELQPLQRGGDGRGGSLLGSGPKSCGMDSEVTQPGEETEAQREVPRPLRELAAEP